MDPRIDEVLNALRPSVEAEGARLQQLSPAEDGSIRVYLRDVSASCQVVVWTHKLRVERAIRQRVPDVKVRFVSKYGPQDVAVQ